MKISNKIKWSSLSIIFLTLGWVLLNGDKALENINTFRHWHGSSPELTGKWTNSTDGWLGASNWHGNNYEFMEIELEVENYEVEGIVTSNKIKELLPFDFVLFKGKKNYFSNTIEGVAFDFINGNEVNLGVMSLTIDKNGELVILQNEKYASLFPEKVVLRKVSNTAFDSLNEKLEHKNESDKK